MADGNWFYRFLRVVGLCLTARRPIVQVELGLDSTLDESVGLFFLGVGRQGVEYPLDLTGVIPFLSFFKFGFVKDTRFWVFFFF